jgi:uncharacterized protein (TIGR03067 family)
MNAGIAMLLNVCCFWATDVPVQPEAKNQAGELQGTWSIVATERDGQREEMTNRLPPLVIKGDKIYYDGAEVGRVRVDVTTKPKCIDVTVLPAKAGLEGIYALEGNTLKICLNRESDALKERPDKFSTKDKANWKMVVCERATTKEALESKGTSGFIGLQLRFDQDKKQVVITDTIEHSAARQAGLKKDDVIVKAGNVVATDLLSFVQGVRQMPPGSEIIMKIKRDDREQDIKVKVGILPFRFIVE